MDRLHQAVGWDEHRYTAAENAALAVLASRGEVTAAELADAVPALREQIVTFPGRPYESRQRVCATVLGSLAAEGRVRRARPAGNWASAQLRCALAEPLPALPTAEAKAVLARTAIETETARLTTFLGATRVIPCYRPPLERRLTV
ncbi:DNA glycosylase AlkZ-like family protein [Streptomyces flavidovirens]